MSTTLGGYSITKPSGPPTVAVGTATGALDSAAVYQYKVTYVTVFGETDGNTTAASVTTTSTMSVDISAIPIASGSNVTSRKLYRTIGGGSSFLLLATIADNITTTYTDLIADGSLGAAIPTVNLAHSYQNVDGLFKISKPAIYSITSGIVAFAGGGQTSATSLTTEYNIVATVATAADSVKLPEASANLIGMRIIVANDGANSMNVFPVLGQDGSGGTNTAVAVAAAARAQFVVKSATAWEKFT